MFAPTLGELLLLTSVAAPILAFTPDIPKPSSLKSEHRLPWFGDEEFLDIPWDELPLANKTVRILHITDTHFSNKSDESPWSDRMHDSMRASKNGLTWSPTTPAAEFASTLERAKTEDVDLLAIGGDLVNFPSKVSVDWSLEKLKAVKAPFVFTAGNHDWHLERKFDWEESYDSQRMPNEYGALRDLYLGSGKGVAEKSFTDPRFGYAVLDSGLLVVTIDNSNYHVDSQQLEFFSKMVSRGQPLLLLLHIPLYLPGLPSWGPHSVMGHPSWGPESDTSSVEEGRLQWPTIVNSAKNSTFEFIEAVKRAAQTKVLVAVLTGHAHKNAVVPIPCPNAVVAIPLPCQTSAKQFTTRPNSEGWSRLIQLRFVPRTMPAQDPSSHEPRSMVAKPQVTLPSKQDLIGPYVEIPQRGSTILPAWAAQAAMIIFFGVVLLTALTGYSQRFASGKRGSWDYHEIYSDNDCEAALYPGGRMASKLGLVSEMEGMSEVVKYGTLNNHRVDADYGEVLL